MEAAKKRRLIFIFFFSSRRGHTRSTRDWSSDVCSSDLLIQTIRDEAHRFAVTFHRTRRNAQRLTSELHKVPGVGEKTVQKLLKTFGSLEMVRQTPEESLARVIGLAAARRVRKSFDTEVQTIETIG